MKLAALILPIADNKGASLFGEHQWLKHALLQRWGGYTATDARGAWQAPDDTVLSEPSMRYEIAMERADVVDFRAIARDVAKRCRQECVMIVTPCGDVEFVKPENKSQPDA